MFNDDHVKVLDRLGVVHIEIGVSKKVRVKIVPLLARFCILQKVDMVRPFFVWV